MTSPHQRGSGVFIWKKGSVEAEENRSGVCFRPFAGVRLKLRLEVDYEGGADSREKINLIMWSAPRSDEGNAKTHTNQGSVTIKALVVLLHLFRIILHRLFFVHGVEVKRGVTVPGRLEIHS
jgi:hypothetical protein